MHQSPAGRGRRAVPLAVVFAGYLILSLFLYGRASGWDRFLLASGAGDAWSFVWFLNWWPWAIAHGHELLHSRFVYAPLGYDLTWATAVPTASLLALPITLTLGAVVAFNVLSLAAPAISASLTFLLVRRCIGTGLAGSVLCGVLFGFCPYESAQLGGHLNLDLTFPIPLACLLILERLQGRLARGRFIVALALTALAEFGLSAEVFASLCSLGSLVWLLFLAIGDRSMRAALLRCGAEILTALLATVIVLLPWLAHMRAYAGNIPGFLNPPWLFSTNLANLVIPTRLTAVGGQLFAPLTARFSGNPSEQDGYLGLPLLAMLLLLTWQRGRERIVAALLLAIGGLILASLGPSLHVGGWDTRVPLPWWLALHLPLLKGALPARFSLYVALGTAIAGAIWLHGPATPGMRRVRFGVLLAGCVLLLPARSMVQWQPVPALPFFEPANAAATLGPDATVLVLPFLAGADGGATPAMFWQWQAGMRFRQAGGYLSFVPMPLWRTEFVQHLMHDEPSRYFANDLSAFCADNHVSAILAGPTTSPSMLAALRRLGWAEQDRGGIVLFRAPPRAILAYAEIKGEIWLSHDEWSWMGRRAEIVSHGQAAILHVSSVGLPMPATTVTVAQTGSAEKSYPIPANSSLDIPVPATAVLQIRPGATFLPALAFHSPDPRILSFQVSLQPR